jgi:hypothetical protein
MSLSESASSQVQAILQAAEASAEQIKAEAQAEADRIRAAASETKQADVSGLLELVRGLRKDLDALEARITAIHEADKTEKVSVAAPQTARTTRAPKTPPKVEEAEPEPAAATADEDTEGARLIALNMALNGEPRETTDQYLADNFDLADRAALLDEVYASVDG